MSNLEKEFSQRYFQLEWVYKLSQHAQEHSNGILKVRKLQPSRLSLIKSLLHGSIHHVCIKATDHLRIYP